MSMQVRVRYFASLRERFARAGDDVALEPGATVADAWAAATGAEELPVNVRAACNHEYTEPDAGVSDGDEIAFFPPVTGG